MARHDDERFAWTGFYSEVANKLLHFQNDRRPLVTAIADIERRYPELPFAIADQFADGSTGPSRDICPFTTMGIFNRSLTDANRIAIANQLGEFLGVVNPLLGLSTDVNGIPLLNNQRSWFFQFARDRADDAIDTLWETFANAIAFADSEVYRSAFISSYDDAESQPLVRYNLTMGLYWARPWRYVPLDGNSRRYIANQIQVLLPNRVPSGTEYVALCSRLAERFADDNSAVHSFPELSWAAYQPAHSTLPPPDPSPQTVPDPAPSRELSQPYTTDSIKRDGCFLPISILKTILRRLQAKQNIILQGPPGTGKTWLAKRLAYALIGQKDDSKVRSFQFHPNISYEDFVRGWRPDGKGGLVLADGPFLQLAEDARKDPGGKYVIVIEEINRGNPASTFGELLTLLEADKRKADEALAYPREPSERFHIPPNVYVIGTMNTADRSIAMIDLALRRRFAFFDLEPQLSDAWREWVQQECGVSGEFLTDIAQHITLLNDQITNDRNLGRQFRIGHSHVTPPTGSIIDGPTAWFSEIVETEIAPLLYEYWFDDVAKADAAKLELLSVW